MTGLVGGLYLLDDNVTTNAHTQRPRKQEQPIDLLLARVFGLITHFRDCVLEGSALPNLGGFAIVCQLGHIKRKVGLPAKGRGRRDEGIRSDRHDGSDDSSDDEDAHVGLWIRVHFGGGGELGDGVQILFSSSVLSCLPLRIPADDLLELVGL